MSCICLDTNWFLKGLESPCPPDWTALSALFSEDSDSFSLPRFPMQVHDVLLAYGIIENPNIRGVNRDLWIHERDWVYCCRFSAQANIPSLLTFDGVDTFADVWLNGTLLGSCSDVYLAQPPLFKVFRGKKVRYAFSDEERDAYIAELAGESNAKVDVQRYKGLGEMDPEQLWETTMDPAARTMIKVNLEDAAKADEIFSILMGDKVEPRREFIEQNARYAKDLDI